MGTSNLNIVGYADDEALIDEDNLQKSSKTMTRMCCGKSDVFYFKWYHTVKEI